MRLADELPGTWKHLRRGAYRVVPLERAARQVRHLREGEGPRSRRLDRRRRKTKPWMLVAPAAAQTRNEYRDILSASFDYAVRKRWLDANPLAEVKRASKREERERILRRDDFYDPDEIDRLLGHAPGVFEEAFWLCGAHAGLRLPGEALGLRWGAVDFQAGVMRPYDNWVRGELDTTKTSDSEAIPMTPRLARALAQLKQRGYATGDEDFVFVSELTPELAGVRTARCARPSSSLLQEAGLKPIKMYNLRHSFGTSLAAQGRRHQDDPGAHAPRPPEHDRTVHGLRAAAGACESDHAGARSATACPRTSYRCVAVPAMRRRRSLSAWRRRYPRSGWPEVQRLYAETIS